MATPSIPVTVRLTADEYACLQGYAAKNNVAVGGIVRMAAIKLAQKLGAPERPQKLPGLSKTEQRAELRALGIPKNWKPLTIGIPPDTEPALNRYYERNKDPETCPRLQDAARQAMTWALWKKGDLVLADNVTPDEDSAKAYRFNKPEDYIR